MDNQLVNPCLCTQISKKLTSGDPKKEKEFTTSLDK
jgi:hypothetical protein